MRMKNSAKIILLIFGTAFFSAVWKIMTSQLSIEPLRENGIEEDRKELDEWTKKWRMKSCSCAACVSECNTSLMMRYNSTVHPFLTQLENITLEVFSWWKLQRETGSFSKFLEIKERIFTVFPSKPDLVEAGVDRCRTCAVVGNSGNLKGSKYGSRIDAHDTIIRMNVGVTAGFEEDVGTRTTHRIMYPESAISLDNSTHLVLLPFKIMDLQWIIDAVGAGFHDRSYAPVIPNINVNKSLVMIINPAFMKYVHTSWLSSRGHYPSTGFMTLILAMHICDEVKIFGFGADKNGNWNHYWEELKNKKLKTGIHPGTDEYDVIQNLAKQKKITFYRGW